MSSRYEREIEDILKKAGGFGSDPGGGGGRKKPRSRNVVRLSWLYVRQSLSGKPWSVSPGRVMLIGFALLLSTLLVMPFVDGVAGYLAWAGLLLCVIGYGMFLARPSSGGVEKRWRGRSVEAAERRSRLMSALDRVRRRFSR